MRDTQGLQHSNGRMRTKRYRAMQMLLEDSSTWHLDTVRQENDLRLRPLHGRLAIRLHRGPRATPRKVQALHQPQHPGHRKAGTTLTMRVPSVPEANLPRGFQGCHELRAPARSKVSCQQLQAGMSRRPLEALHMQLTHVESGRRQQVLVLSSRKLRRIQHLR